MDRREGGSSGGSLHRICHRRSLPCQLISCRGRSGARLPRLPQRPLQRPGHELL